MKIKKYSIDILKPDWPKWKKSIANFFLFNLPFLKIRKVNRMLKKRSRLRGGDFIQQVCNDLGFDYKVYHPEEIPKTGPVTMVANHPGGADVVGTIAGLWDYRKDFQVLANELICVEPVVDLVIPVNVMKKSNKVDDSLIHKAYQTGKMVVYFAAGKNSRYNEEGLLRDRRWRTSFLDFAFKYKTPLLVMHIEAKNTKLFYWVSTIREKFDALKKIPLENMFQLREIIKQKGKTVELNLAKLISFEEWSQYYKEGDIKANRLLADQVYNLVYTMDKENYSLQWNKV